MNDFGSVFAALFLGHLVGDYLLQNDWMATNKTKGKALDFNLACFVHVKIYTMTVFFTCWWCADMSPMKLGFVGTLSWLFFLFQSHYWIDRYSLGETWGVKVKGNRSLRDTLTDDKTPKSAQLFAPLVYVGVDNTLHLVLMTVVAKMHGAW